jgi:sugar lactone lactonase YvrE
LCLEKWSEGSTTLAIDLPRKRLLVTELGNNSVAVVDLTKGALFKRIAGLREPQGVAYAPKGDLIFVANAADGAVDIFKADDLTPAGKVDLRTDADNIRADGADRMIVGYGGGALAVLDSVSGKKLCDIRLAAHPESFQLELAALASTSTCPKPVVWRSSTEKPEMKSRAGV